MKIPKKKTKTSKQTNKNKWYWIKTEIGQGNQRTSASYT